KKNSVQLIQTCSPTFNESEMFNDTSKAELKRELRSKFRNISEIMDCITCETCKVTFDQKEEIIKMTLLITLFSRCMQSYKYWVLELLSRFYSLKTELR